MSEVSTVVEHPLGERTPAMVKLSKKQKDALKGMPKPGWFMQRNPFIRACSWDEYKALRDAQYIVEHDNMFDIEPDIGITTRGLRAIKKKKKAPQPKPGSQVAPMPTG